jgi:hypothetical protein
MSGPGWVSTASTEFLTSRGEITTAEASLFTGYPCSGFIFHGSCLIWFLLVVFYRGYHTFEPMGRP